MPYGIVHPIVWGTSVNSLVLILKAVYLFLPRKLIFWKSYHSWLPSKFSKAHISVVENPPTTIHYHIINTPTLNIFPKTLQILQKKTPKLVAKIWLPNLVSYQTDQDPWYGISCRIHGGFSFTRYRKTSNISLTLVGNKIVDHSDVVGASPVGAAPTTSSFSTWHLASRDSAKKAARQCEKLLSVGVWCVLY